MIVAKQSFRATFVLVAASTVLTNPVWSADWPMWRADAQRSASTSEELPESLHQQWSRREGQLKPAWPEDTRLQFDACYQPIVMGQTMFVSSSRNDSVTAVNTNNGEVRWRFFADGPVRFAPVAWQGKVYFGADDGCLYCVDAAQGALVWKFNAAPAARNIIGNERLISVWPVRGGPVLADGKIYFTVGVWPFEGTLLYSLDADTGAVVAVDKSGGSESPAPNHMATMLKDQSPQGYLAANGDNLFIPCGRANVFGVNRLTNQRVGVKYDSKGLTDYHVIAANKWLFHGDKVVDVATQKTLAINAHRPVVDGANIYFASKGQVVAYISSHYV